MKKRNHLDLIKLHQFYSFTWYCSFCIDFRSPWYVLFICLFEGSAKLYIKKQHPQPYVFWIIWPKSDRKHFIWQCRVFVSDVGIHFNIGVMYCVTVLYDYGIYLYMLSFGYLWYSCLTLYCNKLLCLIYTHFEY